VRNVSYGYYKHYFYETTHNILSFQNTSHTCYSQVYSWRVFPILGYKRDSRRVACAGVSRARYRPVHEMCPVAPHARYIEVIVIIFFDFSHVKFVRAKQIRLRCARWSRRSCSQLHFDVGQIGSLASRSMSRLLSFESRRNHDRDTETFTGIHRFLYPLTFRYPSNSTKFDWNEHWMSVEICVDNWLDICIQTLIFRVSDSLNNNF